MKRVTVIVYLVAMLVMGQPAESKAQSYEVQQLLLDFEKLTQFKQILRDLYKGYEIVSNGYNAIKNISQGNFNLHQAFLDGLLQVSPAIQKYKRVADIIRSQLLIVKEGKSALGRFRQSGGFTDREIAYIERVYENLFNESAKRLDDLITVITAGKLRMSDDERIQVIDRIFEQVSDQLGFLRSFNNSTSLLSYQRGKEKLDVEVSKKLLGITK